MNRTIGMIVIAGWSAAAWAAGDRDDWTGTWKWGNAQRGGGELRTIGKAGRVEFQLELWRGAPSYNEGSLEGSVALEHGKGTFHGGEGGSCEIAFEFKGNTGTLQTVGSDDGCGFGYGVHADGTYVRKSRKKPHLDPPE